ncbi:MAG: tRNA (adenosine(37)-N6)-threonylcarbamoyltransferase complex dimerization subunit type 1 TsaB [Rickettsiales bacterium]|nr:tRNA (adenosine(37)-N6)-threonylcarbamoyltransferase complex dimerization subunit type 1 TsaB [Rickettsiales bacterium]
MSNPTILAIETSTNLGSVALCIGNEVFEHTFSEPHQQAKQLVPTVNELLKSHKKPYQAIDKLVITSGPGSFTGLRIGLSVARMIHFANPNMACHSITSLECTAYGYEGTDNTIQVVLNAGKGEFYSQSFSQNGSAWLASDEIALLKPEDIITDTTIIGQHPDGIQAGPHATQLIQALQPDSTPVESLKPYYFRPPDAKLPTKPYL